MNDSVRAAAVAGMFYPGSKETLSRDVDALLADAQEVGSISEDLCPKVLVVPHAGYVYSGSTAAFAYATLKPFSAQIKRVVLLGPTHRIPVRGLAFPESTEFATPLGSIPIDQEALKLIQDLPQVVVSDPPHELEHSLEVQLPFLQKVLDNFQLVPLAVGDAAPEEVAQVLERLWGGNETLILISTDLSHFNTYDHAERIDKKTVDKILSLDGTIHHDQACGGTPVNGLLLTAQKKSLNPSLLFRCNSGDTAGDKKRVVGYVSVAFFETQEGVTP